MVIDSNILKTEYQFTTFKNFPEFNEGYLPNQTDDKYELTLNGKVYQTLPFTPFDERDFLRGKLIRQIAYEKKDTVFRKLTDTENSYAFNMGFKSKNGNITVWYLPDTLQYLSGMAFFVGPHDAEQNQPPIDLKKYNLYTTNYALKKTVTKNYSYQPSVDSVVSEINYYYEDTPWFKDSLFHFLPTKTVATTSKGKEALKNYYPYHWRYTIPESTSPDLTAYKTLDTLNRIGVPVVQVKEDSASASNLTTIKNSYSALVNSSLALNKVSKKDGSSLLVDLVSFNLYDTLGNLLDQQKTSNLKESYIWDYKSSYPVAQVANGSYSSIAFTSFESDGKGNWAYSGTPAPDASAPTGKKAFTIVNSSNNITKSGLSTSTTYIVSYWKKSGTVAVNGTTPVTGRTINSWTYYEHTVVNPSGGLITVSGTNGVIDELRLYPALAQMTTYTYNPLIGITSQCDANNRITYYEYDGFNRLSLLRDADRNILKKICYNYAGQPEDCGLIVYSNVAKSGNFTRNNCGTNGTGGTVAYNVAAGIYTSNISQTDADQKAQNDVNTNGQAYANANAGCTWTNQAQSGNFTRNNCPANYTGSTVTYNVAANTYSSTVSLSDANQQAINDVNANGQNYANTNGTCISNCNSSNCTGESKKCINGVCETGVKVNTDSYYNGTKWVCVYHYEWSDGSWSTNYTSLGNMACPY